MILIKEENYTHVTFQIAWDERGRSPEVRMQFESYGLHHRDLLKQLKRYADEVSTRWDDLNELFIFLTEEYMKKNIPIPENVIFIYLEKILSEYEWDDDTVDDFEDELGFLIIHHFQESEIIKKLVNLGLSVYPFGKLANRKN